MKQPKKKTDHLQDQFQDISQYAAQNEEVELVHQKPDIQDKTHFSTTLKTPGGQLSLQADLPDRHDFGLETHLDRKSKTKEKGTQARIVEQDETVDFQTDAKKTDLHAVGNREEAAGTLAAKSEIEEKAAAESISQTGHTTTVDQETIEAQAPMVKNQADGQPDFNRQADGPQSETIASQPISKTTASNPMPPINMERNRPGPTTKPASALDAKNDQAMIDAASNPQDKTAQAVQRDANEIPNSIGIDPESINAGKAEDQLEDGSQAGGETWSQEEQTELEEAGLDLDEYQVEEIEAVDLEETTVQASESSQLADSELPAPKAASIPTDSRTKPTNAPAGQTKDSSLMRKPLDNTPLHSNATPKQPASSNLETAALDDDVPKPISPRKRFIQIVKTVRKYKALHDMTPVKLRMILEDLGPTYVKLGQIMSSRSDLLPSEYTKELEKLRSNVAPMPYETVRKEIIKAYGKTPEELFTSFSKEPLGSASMAQVHEAITHDGQKVVVKVQRPGIYEQMKVDVEMLRKAGKVMSLSEVVRDLVDVEEVVNEFWTSAKEEMDFRHEAGNALRFAKECEGLQYIHVPKIYTDYTKPNILVMEEIGGVQIDDYPALAKLGYDRREIATRLGMNFLSQVIDDGFFHADPHSGNLKIDDGKICWLDFGMMGEINKSESAAISQALQALAARDTSQLTDAVLAIGIPPDDLDYVGFSNALDRYLARYVGQDFASLDLGKMIEEAIEVCNAYKIRLPKGITMLARSMVTIQGTLKDLDPSVNMAFYISESKTSIDQIDWNQELQKWLRQGYADGKALMNLPLKLDHILGLLQRGQLRVGLSLAELQSDLLPEVNRWVDRLIVCILIAALLMGSSIICTTNMKPRFLEIPLLGFAGFFLSFCLSLWLFYKMIFHAKKGNKLF